MSEQDDKFVEALHGLRRADQEAESELLRQVAAGERAADTVDVDALDDDPETQALLLELSAPAGEAFRASLADRVDAQLNSERDAGAETKVVSMAAFRRKRAGVIATLAVAAAAAFMVLRSSPPDEPVERGDALGVFEATTVGYTLTVTKSPKSSRGGETQPTQGEGSGTEDDPVALQVPTSGEVEWILRPDQAGAAAVGAKVFVRGPDGGLTPAGDEITVTVAKTGAVRVSLQLDDAPYVRSGAQVDVVVVVGDADVIDDLGENAGLEVIGVKAPGAKRFIRFNVD